MKKITLLLAFAFCSFIVSAQKVTTDANGNYKQVKTERTTKEGTNTGKTYTTTKGEVFPVYQSVKGKLYIVRTSAKTGKTYNQYLKLEN